MGVWNETTPTGSDNAREGDDRIRELKVALGEALSHEDSTFPGASPGSTPIFIPGFLRGNTASRPTGGSLVNGRLYINTETGVLERYNGSTWDPVYTNPIDASIDANKLSASVAGSGLSGGAGTPLAVNVGTGLEISSDTVRIAAAAAGSGLTGGGASALEVYVDDTTIEVNSDVVRVKNGGITSAKIAAAYWPVPILYQGVFCDASTFNGAYTTVLDVSGHGAIKGIHLDGAESSVNGGTSSWSIRIILDGTTYELTGLTGTEGTGYAIAPRPFATNGSEITNLFVAAGPAGVGDTSSFYFPFRSSLQVQLQNDTFSDGTNGFFPRISYDLAT